MSDDSYGEFRRLVSTLKEEEDDATVTIDLRELALLLFERDRPKSYEHHMFIRQKRIEELEGTIATLNGALGICEKERNVAQQELKLCGEECDGLTILLRGRERRS